tara:strand:- start:4958 stop:5113 length:156 start_codon:yes stop_codon:yes gene_type:complete
MDIVDLCPEIENPSCSGKGAEEDLEKFYFLIFADFDSIIIYISPDTDAFTF